MSVKKSFLNKTKKELDKYYEVRYSTIPTLENEIKMHQDNIEDKINMIYDGMPHSSRGLIETRREKILDKIIKLKMRIDENKRYLKFIENTVSNLDILYSEMIKECYLKEVDKRKSDDKLADKFNCSTRSIQRYKKQALEDLTVAMYGIESYYK